MPSKTQKRSPSEKKIDDRTKNLTRLPLYPDLEAEKENMRFSSSDDSPEKARFTYSPTMSRKSNSASSTDSMQDSSNNPKHRNGEHQQYQNKEFQDVENSDEDMETDNIDNRIYPPNLRKEKSEISPDSMLKCLPPKSDSYDNSASARRRNLYEPERAKPSIRASNSSRSSPDSGISSILFLVISFVCIVLGILWGKNFTTPNMNDQLNVTTLINNLRSEFAVQPRMTFRIIHSALKNVLETQPGAPAVILLLATNGSKTVCSKFADKLVDLLSLPEYTLKISGEDYNVANTDHAKMDIDEAISKTLKIDQLGSVLIKDLDRIQGQTAMILHKYYDHEHAPFKKAVFVMTVDYNKAIDDYSDIKVWDKAANDHLLSIWTDIEVDQAMPLLSRLTVSVAVIKA